MARAVYRRSRLVVRGRGIDRESLARWNAAGGEHLPLDGRAVAVACQVLPHDEEAPVRQRRNGRGPLRAGLIGDGEFPTDLVAVCGNDLAANVFVAVGRIDRIRPHNDNIAVRQLGEGRACSCARPHPHGAGFGRDVDVNAAEAAGIGVAPVGGDDGSARQRDGLGIVEAVEVREAGRIGRRERGHGLIPGEGDAVGLVVEDVFRAVA